MSNMWTVVHDTFVSVPCNICLDRFIIVWMSDKFLYVEKHWSDMVLGQLPTKHNFPPDKNKAQPLPTGTTIPRTIPHQDTPH